MYYISASSLIVCLVTSLGNPAVAGLKPEQIQTTKHATALVVLPSERGFGTAFCVDESGFFITNEHVVRGVEGDKTVSLVFDSGGESEKVVGAKVVRADADHDLALLKVDGVKGLRALGLGDEEKLLETSPVTVFGFPFGTGLAVRQKKFPAISVHVGRVTSLRKSGDGLESIQVDAPLNGGNSGGVAVDDSGKVIGVVRPAIRGARLNHLIPSTLLRAFLGQIELVFSPTTVPFYERYGPTTFEIRAVSFLDKDPHLAITAQFEARGTTRVVEAKKGDGGIYRAVASLLEKPNEPNPIPVRIDFPSGTLSGSIDDRSMKLGEREFLLSDLTRIDVAGSESRVVTQAGGEFTGSIAGLGEAIINLGGVKGNVDIGKASRIIVQYVHPIIDQVDVKITATRDNEIVDVLRSVVRIGEAPAAARTAIAEVDGPVLQTEKAIIQLPAAIEQVAVGGGGRYLIFYLKRLGRLAVFDVSQAKVVRYLPCPTGDFLFTAGAEHLIVADNDRLLLERRSLDTLEKEISIDYPMDYALQRLAMGHSSYRLLLWREPNKTTFMDARTMKSETLRNAVLPGSMRPHDVQFHPADDGQAVAIWHRRQSYDSVGSFLCARIIADEVVLRRAAGASSFPAFASIDGGKVFIGNGLVFTPELKPLPARALKDALLLPVGRSFVVATRWTKVEKTDTTENVVKATMNVYFMTNLELAFPIGDVEELNNLPREIEDPTPFPRGDRIHFVPSANVLVTIGHTNDYLVVRKINVDKALKESGKPHLFVRSTPVRSVRKGELYRYRIRVRSSASEVGFELASAPEGMQLSESGELLWPVPKDIATQRATVIVRIIDAIDQQTFHSFQIAVE